MFRFVIPGVGEFTVQAANMARARQLVQNRIAALGFPLDVTEIQQALDAGRIAHSADIGQNDVFIRDPNPAASGDGGQQAGTGTDGSTAGQGAALGAAAGGTASPAAVGDLPRDQRPGGGTGVDPVFTNPTLEFAAFANALSNRGFNPEGALGSTLMPIGGLLSNLADVGTNVGTIPGIGTGPGATQAFFENNLGRGATGGGVTGNLEQQFQDTLNALAAQREDPTLSRFFAGDPNQDLEAFRATRDLARNTAATRLGSFGAQFLPSDTQFRNRFDRMRAAASGPESVPDFFTFARQTFGV